ncbi:pseudouridine synthase [Sporodiniella umbellata]|nr:pseudouridine synthase [Sporodiniella umbellata]
MSLIKNIPVLYRDGNWLIVNKPFDMRIQNYSNCIEPTVESILKEQFPDIPKLRNVHQLDYATSGVFALALNKRSASLASKNFRERTVKKTYLALVNGHMQNEEYVVDHPIDEDPEHNFKMRILPTGKPAKTQIQVLERGYYSYKEEKTGAEKRIPITKVSLCPISGRRHQLRLHLQSLGHPIVGDFNYELNYTDTFRMMLHAHRLSLRLDEELPDFIADDPFVGLTEKRAGQTTLSPDNACFWPYAR